VISGAAKLAESRASDKMLFRLSFEQILLTRVPDLVSFQSMISYRAIGRCFRRIGLPSLAALAGLAIGAGPALAASSGVIVMYHRFGEDRYPSTSVTVEQLESHIQELQSGTYTVMPLAEMMAAVRQGTPLPERAVAITIDDAYRSLYDVAWPRFKEAGLPITVFVATGSVDRNAPDTMTWEELRELHAAGVELGSQTVTHLHMADASDAVNKAELENSARRIAEEIGVKPRFFAFPYGEASAAAKRLAEQAGYETAFGQHSGAVYRGADFMYLPRYPINMAFGGLERFRRVVNTLPLAVTDVHPADPKIGRNPPDFGFTLPANRAEAIGLACYHSAFGALEGLQRLGERRIEIRFDRPFPEGRNRINCTAPGPTGRWRWFGMQYYVPPQ